MRMLTTDAGQEAGYSIIRSLREHCEFVGVGYYGGQNADIGRSRHVDGAVALALPKVIGRESVESGQRPVAVERAWGETLLDYCRQRRIDTIVPTTDAEVFALSKLKSEFVRAGVRVPIPAFDVTYSLMNKLEAPRLAAAHGLPTPRFEEAATLAQANDFAARCGYPLVVKEPFGFFSRGVRLVGDEEALRVTFTSARQRWPRVGLQEYVRGDREPSIMLAMGPDGCVREAFVVRKLRYAQSSFSTCIQSAEPLVELDRYIAFAEGVGVPGIIVAQLKEDARDGAHRLIEINCRLGANSRILTRMALREGMNPVLAALSDPATTPGSAASAPRMLPPSAVGVSPAEDVLALRTWSRARDQGQPDNPVPSLMMLLRCYARSYLSRRVVLDWFATAIVSDHRAVRGSWTRNLRVLWHSEPNFIPWGELRRVGSRRDRSTPRRDTSSVAHRFGSACRATARRLRLPAGDEGVHRARRRRQRGSAPTTDSRVRDRGGPWI